METVIRRMAWNIRRFSSALTLGLLVNMKFDWKFLLPLLAAVASVAAPIWLWQADQNSKSLSIKLATRISIQPKELGTISGVEISAGGIQLTKPHLVVFEIRNNGSKPIPTADFESAVKIKVTSDTKLVRADITDKSPKDIDATLVSDSESMSLKPTLLNPGDAVTVTAITSGDGPIFQSMARIVGISSVTLEDGTTKKPDNPRRFFLALGSVFSLIIVWLISDGFLKVNGIFLRRRAAVCAGVAAIFSTTIMLQIFFEENNTQELRYQIFWYVGLLLFASLIASLLNQKPKATASDEIAKQIQHVDPPDVAK